MKNAWPHALDVMDSHTEGGATRVVRSGAPTVLGSSLAAQRDYFHQNLTEFREAVLLEPRGNNALVGALVLPAQESDCLCGVIFFNNAGVLGMCGHAMIGLIETLSHWDNLQPGTYRVDTPVGVVNVERHDTEKVSITNVASRQICSEFLVRYQGQDFVGDLAYGGNGFFICENPPASITLQNLPLLTEVSKKVKLNLDQCLAGPIDGVVIDHVEFVEKGAVNRNFVLCPGGVYDRSPCGTGTSARVACLAEKGLLQEGEIYRVENVHGGVFEASYQRINGLVVPTISGRAHVIAETTLYFRPDDPMRFGFSSSFGEG
jgi:proline racemase